MLTGGRSSEGLTLHKDERVWGCIRDVVEKLTLEGQAVNMNFHNESKVFVFESDKFVSSLFQVLKSKFGISLWM